MSDHLSRARRVGSADIKDQADSVSLIADLSSFGAKVAHLCGSSCPPPSNRATVPGKLHDPFDCVEQSARALLTAIARALQGADVAVAERRNESGRGYLA